MLAPKFKDPEIENRINEDGYVVIKGFLPQIEIEKITNIYKASHQECEVGCWNSLYDLPLGHGKEISATVTEIVKPYLDKLFQDYDFPVALFISKNPGQGHESLVHRDDSMHNENEFQYRQCWVPIVDINKENGTLYVVPKSHKLFTDERPMFAKWPYTHLRPRLEKEFVNLYPKAGDLVVYFEKTLHGSYLNSTNESRPVFQGGVIHKDAQSQFTRYIPERNEVERYAVDFEFFLNKEYLNPQIDPKYPLIASEPYQVTKITEEDVNRFYSKEHETALT